MVAYHTLLLTIPPPVTHPTHRALRLGACLSLRELHLRNNDVRGEGLRELLGCVRAWR